MTDLASPPGGDLDALRRDAMDELGARSLAGAVRLTLAGGLVGEPRRG